MTKKENDHPELTNEQYLIAAICEAAYNKVGHDATQNAIMLASNGNVLIGSHFDTAIQAAIMLQEIVVSHRSESDG